MCDLWSLSGRINGKLGHRAGETLTVRIKSWRRQPEAGCRPCLPALRPLHLAHWSRHSHLHPSLSFLSHRGNRQAPATAQSWAHARHAERRVGSREGVFTAALFIPHVKAVLCFLSPAWSFESKLQNHDLYVRIRLHRYCQKVCSDELNTLPPVVSPGPAPF